MIARSHSPFSGLRKSLSQYHWLLVGWRSGLRIEEAIKSPRLPPPTHLPLPFKNNGHWWCNDPSFRLRSQSGQLGECGGWNWYWNTVRASSSGSGFPETIESVSTSSDSPLMCWRRISTLTQMTITLCIITYNLWPIVEVTLTLKAPLQLPPVCEPRWAWWAWPVPPCSRCRDTGCVQRPPRDAPAACGWRWCGGVSWRGRGTPCPVCPGWGPLGSHPVTPSSQPPWYLFSGGKRGTRSEAPARVSSPHWHRTTGIGPATTSFTSERVNTH